jgi:hypothetical protein
MFDRSKIKGAKISTLKKSREEAEKKSYNNSRDRVGFLKIEEGVNIFRIYPPHDPSDPPYQPLRTTYLKCEVNKYENGELTEETEVRTKRVFISTIHGNEEIKGDPVELYIKYAYQKAADEYQDKDERQKFLNPITGHMLSGKWHPGIRPQTNYIYYAEKSDEFGRLELSPQITKRMEELNVTEQYDQPIETDIFSDPDNGYLLKIIYDKSAKKGKKFNISKVEFNPRGLKPTEVADALKKFQEESRISDEKLEFWLNQKSLKELYKDVYSTRDFDLALDGLKRFDEENEFDIFENDEFLTELQAIAETVPEPPQKETEDEGETKKEQSEMSNQASSTQKENEKETKEDEENADKWSKIKCTKFLQVYVEENYGDDVELPALKLKELREWSNLALLGEELPFPEESQNEPEPQTENKPDVSTKEDETPSEDRLAAIRARLQQK